MQNCRAQLECIREEERNAEDLSGFHCLQDETTRKDKAGIQSSQYCLSLLQL